MSLITLIVSSIVFFLPISFFLFTGKELQLREATFIKASVFYLLILVLFSVIIIRKFVIKFDKKEFILPLSFILIQLLTLIWSINKFEALRTLLLILVGPISFIITLFVENKVFITVASSFTSLLVSSYAILQQLGFIGHWYKKIGEIDLPDSSATFEVSNNCVEYLVTVLPLSISLTFTKKGFFRYVALLSCLVSFSFCILSGVRAGYFSLVAAILVSTLLIFKKSKRWYSILPLLFLIPFFTSGYVFSRLLTSFQEIKVFPSSVTFRLEAWKTSLRMILEKPQGVGIGQFEVFSQKYKTEKMDEIIHLLKIMFEDPHNEYLLLACETGILSLIIFLLFTARILWIKVKDLDVISIGLICGIFSHLVFMLFGFALTDPAVKAQFWIQLALLRNFRFNIEKGKSISVLFSFLAFASALFMILSVNETMLTIAKTKGIFYANRGLYEKALKELKKIPDAHFIVARTLMIEGDRRGNLDLFRKASEYFEEGFKLHPFFGIMRKEYAKVLYNLGKYTYGIEQLYKSLETEIVARAEIYALLSVFYSKIGDCQKSYLYSEKAFSEIKLKPQKEKELEIKTLILKARRKCE